MASIFKRMLQLAQVMEDEKPKEPTITEKMMGMKKPKEGLFDWPRKDKKVQPKKGWGWGKKPKQDEGKK